MACTVSEHFSDFEKLIREPRYSADTGLESVPIIVSGCIPQHDLLLLQQRLGLQPGPGPAGQDVLQQGQPLLAVEGGADQRAEQRHRQATTASVGLDHSTVPTEYPPNLTRLY